MNTELARKFLTDLFEDKPEDQFILLWTLPEKKSIWVQTIDEAVYKIHHMDESCDVYFGVGTSPDNPGHFKRCPASRIAGIPGLWADIDIAGERHKKSNLFQSRAEADEMLMEVGLEPTLTINSGGGYHLYWLFNEFWNFEDKGERTAAAELSEKWNRTLRAWAARMDRDIDLTYDLSRILRVPGTLNNKHEPVPVELVLESGKRYEPEDFDVFIPEDVEVEQSKPQKQNSISISADFELDPKGEPPAMKLLALMQNSEQFKRTWDRQRTEWQDQSASAYDMSLATQAAFAEWSDQEIANLLVAWRRENDEDLKLREDYYIRTLAKARQAVQHEESDRLIEELSLKELDLANAGMNADPEKYDVYRSISIKLELVVYRIARYMGSEPKFEIETEKGDPELGDGGVLLSQTRFRNALFSGTTHTIRRFKNKEWDGICKLFSQAIEDVDTGSESFKHGRMKTWLQRYITDKNPVDVFDERTILAEIPFYEDDMLHIFSSSLKEWLNQKIGERNISYQEMGGMLKKVNAQVRKKNCTVDGKPTSRNLWILPDSVFE